jgi:hypothetical protein
MTRPVDQWEDVEGYWVSVALVAAAGAAACAGLGAVVWWMIGG